MEAFLDGLERARAAGRDLSRLTSVASFFVSRVDTEIDKRLDKIGSEEAKALKGKAAIANARLAYQLYEEVFGTDRWTALAAAGGLPQRPLWASTGVKDPAYDDTMYVVDLVAPGVVNTMPEATLNAVADHGVVTGDTIRPHYADAKQVLDDLAAIGIDYDDVVQVLEDEARGEVRGVVERAARVDEVRADPARRGEQQVSTSGAVVGRRARHDDAARRGRRAATAWPSRSSRRTPTCGARRRSRRQRSGSAGSTCPSRRRRCSPSCARCTSASPPPASTTSCSPAWAARRSRRRSSPARRAPS